MFGDQVVLPLSAGHFSCGLLGHVPEERWCQIRGTGSCGLWNLVPRAGRGFGSSPFSRSFSSVVVGRPVVESDGNRRSTGGHR